MGGRIDTSHFDPHSMDRKRIDTPGDYVLEIQRASANPEDGWAKVNLHNDIWGDHLYYVSIEPDGMPKKTNAKKEQTAWHLDRLLRIMAATGYPKREYWDMPGNQRPLLEIPSVLEVFKAICKRRVFVTLYRTFWEGKEKLEVGAMEDPKAMPHLPDLGPKGGEPAIEAEDKPSLNSNDDDVPF